MPYLIAPLFLIQNAMAWGTQGHKIVAKIAEDNLSSKAKIAISKLLPKQSLADASTWADEVRSDPNWKHTKSWHFVDIADGDNYETIPSNPEGDIITAITDMTRILKSPKSTTREKQDALKFLIHFVGDLHQPLHVGRPDDHGGNTVHLIFDGKRTNLHSLWDSGMIAKQGMDYQEYADHLQLKHAAAKSYDIPEIKFSQIINEGMSLRDQIYFFHSFDFEDIVLDENYMERNLSTMDSRLLIGGKRLASLLNKIFI